MEVKAWIQMGCERRHVEFEVTDEERREHAGHLEAYIEAAVLDWVNSRYGWGWSCELFHNDFSGCEDNDAPSLVVTQQVLNPSTERSP